MSAGTIGTAAAALNNLVSLLEAYIEAPDAREPEMKRWVEQAGATLRTLHVMSASHFEWVLAAAMHARGTPALDAQQLWDTLADVRDAFLSEHTPPRPPEQFRW